MRGWFPRHWKCRLVSEIGGKLSRIESLYPLLYHLTYIANFEAFFVCKNDTLLYRLCCSSELSASF